MWDLNYPTFSAMSRHAEIEWLWQQLEETQEVSLLRILEIVLGPLVALVVGVMGIYQESRKVSKVGRK